MPSHSRWERTPIRGTEEQVLTTLVEQFGWTLAPIADYPARISDRSYYFVVWAPGANSEMLLALPIGWKISLCAAALVYLAALCAGCGGSGGSNTSVLSVGGTYQTEVTLLPGNSCGNVTVQNNPTTVTHNPGAQTLSIRHVSISAAGAIDSTAHFSTDPTTVSGFTVTITGQFSIRGFDATVTLSQAQPPCQYMVRWAGTKDGAPNTIP